MAQTWEVKQALARHLWEDAEHMWSLAERTKELRGSSGMLRSEPDVVLAAALREIAAAPSETAYVAGVYRVIKPALIAAFRLYMQETNALADQPTVRLLRHILLEEEEQIVLMEERLAEVLTEPGCRVEAEDWCTHLSAWLAACGSLLGTEEPQGTRPPSRAGSGPTLPAFPGRDDRFPAVLEHKGDAAARAQGGRIRWMMRVRMYEMAAAEVPASVLFDRPEMPLEFYRDAARHIWDEVRHSMFGQAAIEADGHTIDEYSAFVGDYSWSIRRPAAERYAWLTIGLENAFMRYPPGKREEYEYCRDEAQHPLMTLFQDYDWADEVVHAQLGRQWAPPLMGKSATLEQARELGDRLAAEFFTWLAAQTGESRPGVGEEQTAG